MNRLICCLAFSILALTYYGQTPPGTQIKQNKDSTRFIKYTGWAVAGGSLSSPTGAIGLYWPLLLSSKHIDFSLGIGWSGVTKTNSGIGFHTDMRKQLCPFITIEYVYSFGKRDLVFNENKSNERHYKVGAAQLLNYGIGIMWQPKSLQDPDLILSAFIKGGYRQLISDYSIDPKDPARFYRSEKNTLYYEFFESRLFWSIGIRVNGRLKQVKH